MSNVAAISIMKRSAAASRPSQDSGLLAGDEDLATS